jgi:SulP family sulfate permease
MTMATPEDKGEAANRLDQVQLACSREAICCNPVLRQGSDPIKEVVEAARAADSNLLVIGRRPPKGLADRMVGVHTAKIITDSPCHVLVVPQEARMWEKRIMVCFDASPSAVAAAEIAATLAKNSGIPVSVVSVTKENHPAIGLMQAALDETVQMLKLEGIEADSRLAFGPTAETLLAQADALGADLVVVGMRHGGLHRALPSRVVDPLLGHADRPVLIAKTTSAKDIADARGRF